MSKYTKILDFGTKPFPNNDPVTFCLGDDVFKHFNHGSNLSIGQNNKSCQIYLADRCARNWDGVCDAASNNKLSIGTVNVNMLANVQSNKRLTPYQLLLKNTAERRFLVDSVNCTVKSEPFNFMDPTSEKMSWLEGQNCVKFYAVDDSVDDDEVMNRVLNEQEKSGIFTDFLLNIYNTMKQTNTLHMLKGTRLGQVFF